MLNDIGDTAAASTTKVVAVTMGAGLSSLDGIPFQSIIWIITVVYGVMQIVKGLPWMTEYTRAIYIGVRKKDWSYWRSFARRTESDGDDNHVG